MMEYEKRPMIETEDKYTFRQSSQLCSQTGLIGYLRADFGTDGKDFYSSWEDWRKDLKTPEFKQEFDDIINSLREDGDILHSRRDLSRYCNETPQSQMTIEPYFYGVRVDTERYAYLLRLNPNKGDYNLYCYCYERKWLDNHLEKARRGIRFITPDYKEKFRIADGDSIILHLSNGNTMKRTCRYIDDYHLEVGDNLYHICEFAELCERNGHTVEPAEKTNTQPKRNKPLER